MAETSGADSIDWQRRWTVEAGSVTLEPVTRAMAQTILDGGPITGRFEQGALHGRIAEAMEIAIRDIDRGVAAVLPTVWLVVRDADGRILGDLGTHGPPDSDGGVEIGYSLAPAARGQGIGTAAVSAFLRRLGTVPQVRDVTAVTGAENVASRRLLEAQGFHLAGELRATAEVRYVRTLR